LTWNFRYISTATVNEAATTTAKTATNTVQFFQTQCVDD